MSEFNRPRDLSASRYAGKQAEHDRARSTGFAEEGEHPAPSRPPIMETEDVASMSECTGLVPSAVLDDAQAEHYASLYSIHQQKTDSEAE